MADTQKDKNTESKDAAAATADTSTTADTGATADTPEVDKNKDPLGAAKAAALDAGEADRQRLADNSGAYVEPDDQVEVEEQELPDYAVGVDGENPVSPNNPPAGAVLGYVPESEQTEEGAREEQAQKQQASTEQTNAPTTTSPSKK